MAIASLKDLYFDELGDLYDAETQMIRALPRLVEAARTPELRETLQKHCDESRLHLERLELIFTHWGERRRPHPCAGLAGIVQEADNRLNDAATDDVRDAAIIGAAQRIEHYEIAAYGCARTYARRLNRLDEARLLQETLDEEGRADHRLTEIATAHVNDDARGEGDFRRPSPHRLAYIGMDDVARERGSREPVAIRTGDGELGVLDGLVVDPERGVARYAVVAGGGVLTHRRYLLPLAVLRFDEKDRVLRTTVEKDVAERYPAFDRDEFQSMSDRDRSAYEQRLAALFSKTDERAPVDEPVVPLPEWLLTGAWVTVPPERADRLPPEAHAYVNEFRPVSGDDAGEQRKDERFVAHGDHGHAERPARADEDARPPRGDRVR